MAKPTPIEKTHIELAVHNTIFDGICKDVPLMKVRDYIRKNYRIDIEMSEEQYQMTKVQIMASNIQIKQDLERIRFNSRGNNDTCR